MTNEEKDFLRQFGGSVTRYVILTFGLWLASSGWISETRAGELLTADNIERAAGALIILAPFVWSWFNKKFNARVKRVARAAKEDTPMSEITAETRKQVGLLSTSV